MKQKDLAVIIVIVFISSIASYFVSKALFTGGESLHQKVETVDAIEPTFNTPKPDDKFFNDKAVDPTQLIRIGNDSNNDPIKSTSN